MAAVAEIADDRGIEPATMQRSTLAAVLGATNTSAGGKEFRRNGVEEQQTALGTGNPEADACV